MELINLKKLAIQGEMEITFKEKASGRAWKVSRDGILKFAVPKPWGGDPLEHSPEQVMEVADEFSVAAADRRQVLDRKEMEEFLAKSLKSPAATKSADEELE